MCGSDRTIRKNCGENKDNFFESWVIKVKDFDRALMQAYLNSGINALTAKNLNIIESLIAEYNVLISLYIRER